MHAERGVLRYMCAGKHRSILNLAVSPNVIGCERGSIYLVAQENDARTNTRWIERDTT